jgi:hypothetical protein
MIRRALSGESWLLFPLCTLTLAFVLSVSFELSARAADCDQYPESCTCECCFGSCVCGTGP